MTPSVLSSMRPTLGLAVAAVLVVGCTASPGAVTSTAGKTVGTAGGAAVVAGGSGVGYGADGGPVVALGANPASVGFSGALTVQAIYPGPTAATVAVSGSPPHTVLALANPSVLAAASVQANASAAAFRTLAVGADPSLPQAALAPPALPGPSPSWAQDRLEARLQHVDAVPAPPRLGFGVLAANPSTQFQLPSPVAVGSAIGNVVVATQDSRGNQLSGTLTATIQAVSSSPNFVVAVDKNDLASPPPNLDIPSVVADLKATFATTIYPKDTQYFGADPTAAQANAKGLGLQADPVFIVISSQVSTNVDDRKQNGNLGYFTLGDLLPGGAAGMNPSSNQVKAIFISPNALALNRATVYATVAHEFQHMLFSWNRVQAIGLTNHIDEFNSGKVAWINEGLSMLAMVLCGYGPDSPTGQVGAGMLGHLQQFLAAPAKFSLTDFFLGSGNPANPDDAYGEAELFTDLLQKTYGDGVMKAIVTDPQFRVDASKPNSTAGTGDMANISATAMVADALRTHYGTGLAAFFDQFAATLALSGTAAAGGTTFAFGHHNLHATYSDGNTYTFAGPATTGMPTGTYNSSLKSWGLGFAAPNAGYGKVTFSLGTPGEGELILTP